MDIGLYEYGPGFVLERFREGERFRKARACFVEVHAKMLAIIDKLEAARRKEP